MNVVVCETEGQDVRLSNQDHGITSSLALLKETSVHTCRVHCGGGRWASNAPLGFFERCHHSCRTSECANTHSLCTKCTHCVPHRLCLCTHRFSSCPFQRTPVGHPCLIFCPYNACYCYIHRHDVHMHLSAGAQTCVQCVHGHIRQSNEESPARVSIKNALHSQGIFLSQVPNWPHRPSVICNLICWRSFPLWVSARMRQ